MRSNRAEVRALVCDGNASHHWLWYFQTMTHTIPGKLNFQTLSEDCFPDALFSPTRIVRYSTTIDFYLFTSTLSIMAPLQSQPQSPKLFASDIASYSDLELDKYLEANGRSGFFKVYRLPTLLMFRV